MNTSEVIFLGLNSRVIALNRRDGQILWSTPLGGILGDGYVSLNADDQQVYVYAKGQMYCLDVVSGRVLWNNELKGFGYGIGSICVPGFGTTPDVPALVKHKANEKVNDSAGTIPIT